MAGFIDPLDPLNHDSVVCGIDPDGTPITCGEFRAVLADVARLAAERGLSLNITDDPLSRESLIGVT